jgi:hypothetical protein
VIKAPSSQHEYSLIYSGDTALKLPEDEESKAHALKVARDTGDWTRLIDASNGQPTVFHCAQITRTQRDWIIGEVAQSSTLNRPMHGVEMDALVLRVALRKIDNFGAHKVVRLQNRATGIWLAKTEILDAIHDEAGPDVIPELAEAIWERAANLIRPL